MHLIDQVLRCKEALLIWKKVSEMSRKVHQQLLINIWKRWIDNLGLISHLMGQLGGDYRGAEEGPTTSATNSGGSK